MQRLMVVLVLSMCMGVAWAQMVLPREVRQRILQAVVAIEAYDPSVGDVVAAGSGTIISADGFVLTNFHVIGDIDTGVALEWHAIYTVDPSSPDLEPTFRYWARFVAGDAALDLAILQIVEDNEERPLPAGTRFEFLPVGDSNALIPGDPITVVGFPGISGSTVTFTTGIVSGFLGEDLARGGKRWIKTDAKLAGGNSGGSAIDENGALVGIPTLKLQSVETGIVEQQDLLRPVALAYPIISANVPGVARVGSTAPSSVAPAPVAPAPRAVSSAASLKEAGSLDTTDESISSGEYFDRYPISLQAGDRVIIELVSDEFDPYLVLLDPTGDVALEVDDSSASTVNILEEFEATRSGTYTLIVTSYVPGATGRYTLSVTPSNAIESVLDIVAGEIPYLGVGVLERGDVANEGGEYVDFVAIDLPAGGTYEITFQSSEFDAYLVILDPNDNILLEVDDSLDAGLNVRERFTTRMAGTYLFVLSSAFAGETGRYQVEIVESRAVAATPSIASSGVAAGESGMVGALAMGATTRGTLNGDAEFVGYHTYTVNVPADTRQLTIDVNADMDIDLFVKFGSEILAWGDNGDWDLRDIEVDTRAVLTIGNPRPGTYFIDVVNFGLERAQYTLRVRAVAGIPECPRYVGSNLPETVCNCSASATTQSGNVWGTDIYTTDSETCTAALHAGVISETGGIVRVIPMPGQSSYLSSERRGVRSQGWGAWGSSFRVERAE